MVNYAKIMIKIFSFFILHLYCAVLPIVAQPDTTTYEVIDKLMQNSPVVVQTPDSLANFIVHHYQNDHDKVRAAFSWVAQHIQYDVLSYLIELPPMFGEKQQKQLSIKQTLGNKKGVCYDYAVVFQAILEKMGIKSHVIIGVHKEYDFIATRGHAWVAASIQQQWYLFDPTWSAGYINNKKFFPKLTNTYYKVAPKVFIKDHLPSDPLWQFLEHPISFFYFKENKAGKFIPNFFNYTDSLKKYEQQDEEQRIGSSLHRIQPYIEEVEQDEAFKFFKEYFVLQKNNFRIEKYNKNVEKYNYLVHKSNYYINKYNDFINYRNRQFKPYKPDNDIKNMIEEPEKGWQEILAALKTVDLSYSQSQSSVAELNAKIEKCLEDLQIHKQFVEKYIKTSKLLRPTLFLLR